MVGADGWRRNVMEEWMETETETLQDIANELRGQGRTLEILDELVELAERRDTDSLEQLTTARDAFWDIYGPGDEAARIVLAIQRRLEPARA